MSEKGTLGHVRMEALSDGTFAFAMTLLAVDIKPPESFEQLHGVWPQVLSFVVSFVNLGLYWVAHNNEVKEVERTWRGLLDQSPVSNVRGPGPIFHCPCQQALATARRDPNLCL
jgi:uncharacterized membrane protein